MTRRRAPFSFCFSLLSYRYMHSMISVHVLIYRYNTFCRPSCEETHKQTQHTKNTNTTYFGVHRGRGRSRGRGRGRGRGHGRGRPRKAAAGDPAEGAEPAEGAGASPRSVRKAQRKKGRQQLADRRRARIASDVLASAANTLQTLEHPITARDVPKAFLYAKGLEEVSKTK